MPKALPKALKLFLSGLTEALETLPAIKLDTSAEAKFDVHEDALVAWDDLVAGGLDLEKLRVHLKAAKIPLVAMGRLVGAKAFHGRDYIILRKEKSKVYTFFVYDTDTEVFVVTPEISQYLFQTQVMRGQPQGAPPPLKTARLGTLEPDRWGFMSRKVVIPADYQRSGSFVGSWLDMYDYAIPPEIIVPDLAKYDRQLKLDF